MDRFSLVLTALPPDPAEELLEQLRQLGWNNLLPTTLIVGVSDSEARIRKTDLEFLGADLKIVPIESDKKNEPSKKLLLPDISDDEISFEELTLEVHSSPVEFSAPNPELELTQKDKAPIWELSLEDNASAPISTPAISKVESKPSKPIAIQNPTLSFSLEEDFLPPVPEPIPPVSITLPPTVSLETEIIQSPTLDLEKSKPEVISPLPVLETPLTELKEERPTPQAVSTEQAPDNSKVNESNEEESEDWIEDEDEVDTDLIETTTKFKSPTKKNYLLCAGLALLLLLAAYINLMPDAGPPAESNDGSSLVTALLSEQERIQKEERKKEAASLKKTTESSSETIGCKFPIELSSGAITGEIRFGRYQEGLLIESFKIIEEQQEKLSPQDLAAGKIPRPWIKSFEIELPPVGVREALGATYKFKSETRAYLEDNIGTLRVPCILELDCEFKSGANLSCFYNIKNKALYKKTNEISVNQEKSPAETTFGSDLPARKAQLRIEREEALGFLVLVSGNFSAKLNPQ